jgi:glycine dehydrogenase
LEALINFQTMLIDLTGMEIANSSLLDEATAAAEAMAMLFAVRKGEKKSSNVFFVDERIFPQTLDVLQTRATPIGIVLRPGNINDLDLTDKAIFGVIVQNPDSNGEVRDYTNLFAAAAEQQVRCAVIADIMSLIMVKSPGEMGADVVVGNTQRFGVPMGYGGPHAAFYATKEAFKRQIPGRIIGASLDTNGKNAYRMALQTREQHIRREKATSNICTAQVLLAVMAGMYTVYHGPSGLRKIAGRIHALAQFLSSGLKELGLVQLNTNYFDTIKVATPENKEVSDLESIAHAAKMNFRYFGRGHIGISISETDSIETIQEVLDVFAQWMEQDVQLDKLNPQDDLDAHLVRVSDFLQHPVFNSYQSEHEMLRYMKRLENKDLSLTHSMISLGSCTMKLNATSEMIPVTWPELGGLHPFAPITQTKGYQVMFDELSSWLSEITGFAATSLQPNSGAQGEYAGLMVIRAYHEDRGEGHRNVTLIPSSAHGTNPASAVMAGTNVVIVACDDQGNIDLDDMRSKAEQYKDSLAALMVTYPSTHGVYEEKIKEICEIIHKNGGQVYMDGANMNAQVGLTSPAAIGADVCHLNLHKTFAIPHGGGGPGMGPICVAEQLVPFLPGNPVIKTGGERAITAISSAPWGSASVLAISYAYIAMMGVRGLVDATRIAILNANYVKDRLAPHYDILYKGDKNRCAHEMIVDCRDFKSAGIEVEDIAKRLMDYGFHAPTVSFPVAGTLMVEPTESETKAELDRFCDAMIAIRKEIEDVQTGISDPADNALKNAPHTVDIVTAEEWNHSYSRQKAAYPLPFVREQKFWPAVSRIDSAYGDRNLMCSCLPLEAYAEAEA